MVTADSESVRAFVEEISAPTRRRDAEALLTMMHRITGEEARMWGSSIVGFGRYEYRYESGREGEGPAASFSPRKAATVVYLPDGVGAYADRLDALGPHSTGVGSLYLKDLDEVDLGLLEQIVEESFRTLTSGTYAHRARSSEGGRPD